MKKYHVVRTSWFNDFDVLKAFDSHFWAKVYRWFVAGEDHRFTFRYEITEDVEALRAEVQASYEETCRRWKEEEAYRGYCGYCGRYN